MGGIVCLFMIGICLTMIYGVVKEKPSNLLPFFFLQLFDFAVTTLTAAGYICYLRTLHRLISESPRLPWREEILKMDQRTLSVFVLFAFIGMVLIKSYSISIVWRCYKYLSIRHNTRTMLPYILPDPSLHQERAYNSLLPDYEEAIAQSMKAPSYQAVPPPSYQVAMQQQSTETTNAEQASTSQTISDVSPPDYNTVVENCNGNSLQTPASAVTTPDSPSRTSLSQTSQSANNLSNNNSSNN